MPGQALQYRPDIDGLRALAIILVVLGHAGLIFRGGFIGVDVFFVISGFLITSLIGKELENGNFSLARFWMRRVHRLLPALTVASLATVGLGCLLLLPEDLAELGGSLAAHSLLMANVFFWQVSGYFDGAASQKPLIHYWSLAVEEQFYLLFPLLLMLKPGRRVLWILAGLGFLLTLSCNRAHPDACFYLLPFRAWELLAGAGLAVSGWQVGARWRPTASWLGLLGILVGALQIHENKVLWPGWTTLIPCLSTLLLIASCGAGDTAVARLLSHPRVVQIGLISYSWYLWHWSMIAFWNIWKLTRTPVLVRFLWVLLGYLLARLSYRFVETPWRKPRPGWGPTRVLALAAVVQLLLLALGYALQQSQGWPTRFPEPVLKLASRGQPPWANYQVSLAQAREGQFVTLGQEGTVRLWLWGDSHAMAIIPQLELLARRNRCRVVVATHSGAVPLLDYPSPDVCPLQQSMPEWNRQVLLQIQKQDPPPGVLLASRWSYQPSPELGACLEKTLLALTQKGHEVLLLSEVPVYPYDPRKALVRAALLGNPPPQGLNLAQYQTQNSALGAAAEPLRQKGLRLLDPTPCFFPQGSQNAIIELAGRSCYWDDNHLSPQGAVLLSPLLEPWLDDPGRPTKKVEPVGRREHL
jgi:peptidoglycan/LPS O-acetylase OafA/YrhL